MVVANYCESVHLRDLIFENLFLLAKYQEDGYRACITHITTKIVIHQ